MLTYRPALASADETGDRDAWECSILDCIVGSQDDEIFVMRVFRGVEVSRRARHGGEFRMELSGCRGLWLSDGKSVWRCRGSTWRDRDPEQMMHDDDVVDKDEKVTYQVFPNVLLPFCSASRKNCAALNCEARRRIVSHEAHD